MFHHLDAYSMLQRLKLNLKKGSNIYMCIQYGLTIVLYIFDNIVLQNIFEGERKAIGVRTSIFNQIIRFYYINIFI